MSDTNKALYMRFIDEVIGKKNIAIIDELLAPSFVDHNPIPGMAADREGVKQGMGMFLSAFPDLSSTTDFVVAEGDLVVGHHTTTGTNQGEFMGMPATGKKMRMDRDSHCPYRRRKSRRALGPGR